MPAIGIPLVGTECSDLSKPEATTKRIVLAIKAALKEA